jgi:hypothetical protein
MNPSELLSRLQTYMRDPIGAGCRAIRLAGGGALLPQGMGGFPRSRLASVWLKDLQGIEIGGSAANAFGLNTRNVDFVDHQKVDSVYAREQRRVCGAVMPVELIAAGDSLPLNDIATDFVIASHVIEHFYNPIAAILEWVRVSKRFVYIVAPHKDRTFDRDRAVTPVEELVQRFRETKKADTFPDQHWSVWRTEDFVELIEFLELPIHTVQDRDDKIGNGFTVVIGDLASQERDVWRVHIEQKLARP